MSGGAREVALALLCFAAVPALVILLGWLIASAGAGAYMQGQCRGVCLERGHDSSTGRGEDCTCIDYAEAR